MAIPGADLGSRVDRGRSCPHAPCPGGGPGWRGRASLPRTGWDQSGYKDSRVCVCVCGGEDGQAPRSFTLKAAKTSWRRLTEFRRT